MRFADKTVLVTGAARGLGAAMAAGFAREGGNVAIIDLPGSQGGEAAQQINASGVAGSAFFVPCDLADLDRTAQIVRGLAGAHGGVDILVNNAAIFPRKEVANYTIQEWQDVQQVNVAAAFVCVQAVLPEMRAAGFGRIVNISSVTFFGGTPFLAPYVASKGALVGLTRALHIAMNQEEREAAHQLRMQFMRNVQQLSLSPSGDSPTLGRPRRALGVEEMRKATETDALIGTPEEIVERIERLRAGGVEYVLLIDVGGSLSALRTFAREVIPEFID